MTLPEGIRADIDRVSKSVGDPQTAAKETGFSRAAAMAQYLSQIYTGLEACLEKKAKLLGLQLPAKGENYHKALLKISIESGFLPPSCRRVINDLLNFRHFARHAYGADFSAGLLEQKAREVDHAWIEIKARWEEDLHGVKGE